MQSLLSHFLHFRSSANTSAVVVLDDVSDCAKSACGRAVCVLCRAGRACWARCRSRGPVVPEGAKTGRDGLSVRSDRFRSAANATTCRIWGGPAGLAGLFWHRDRPADAGSGWVSCASDATIVGIAACAGQPGRAGLCRAPACGRADVTAGPGLDGRAARVGRRDLSFAPA